MSNLVQHAAKPAVISDRALPSDGILDAVGNTPLVRLNRFLQTDDVELLVKLEYGNPGGSAKDRPATLMIAEALERGDIDQDSVVIESSSGNMGIGLAQACRYHGIRFICVVDPRTQVQNLEIIAAYGGQIEMVYQPLGGDFLAARIARVCQLLESTPNSYWPNQYANPDNPRSHFEGTIAEIDRALDGQFDVLLVATSSTGTAQGCRDYLRSIGRQTEVVAVDSAGSVLFGGAAGNRLIPGLGAGKEPPLARGQCFDHVAKVSDLDCVVGCRRAAHTEALLVGGSAGGVLLTVDRMKHQLAGRRCVAVLHDSGARYMQTVYNDDWVKEHLHCDAERLHRLVHGDPVPENLVHENLVHEDLVHEDLVHENSGHENPSHDEDEVTTRTLTVPHTPASHAPASHRHPAPIVMISTPSPTKSLSTRCLAP